jgi:hypothetical protein
VNDFNPLDIANLMWALANLNIVPSAELIGGLSLQAIATGQQFNSQELALLFWACATLCVGRDLVLELRKQVEIIIRRFNSQDLANVFWSFAKFGIHPGEKLHRELSRQARMVLGQMKLQEISCLMWALAKMNMCLDEGLQQSMLARAVSFSEQLKPQEMSNIMWALATLDVEPSVQLIEAVLKRSSDLVQDFKKQEICNLVWAFACLGLQHKVQFSVATNFRHLHILALKCTSAQIISGMPKESICQIHQVIVSCRLDNFIPDMRLESRLNADFMDHCKGTFETSGLKMSNFQLSVAKCLKNLDVLFTEEYIEQCTGYTVDFMLLNRRGKPCLALEVDGPSHFNRMDNGCWGPNGTTLWKQRLLLAAGFPPVGVPFWEWEKYRNAREQECYLKRLLPIDCLISM